MLRLDFLPLHTWDLWRIDRLRLRTEFMYGSEKQRSYCCTECAMCGKTSHLLCGPDQPAQQDASCPHCWEGEAGGGRYLAPGELSYLRAPSVVSVSHLKADTEKQVKWSPLFSFTKSCVCETVSEWNCLLQAAPVKCSSRTTVWSSNYSIIK